MSTRVFAALILLSAVAAHAAETAAPGAGVLPSPGAAGLEGSPAAPGAVSTAPHMRSNGLPDGAQYGAASTAPASAAEIPFDPEDYPPLSLSEILSRDPCRRGETGYEIKDALLSAELAYHGALRTAPKSRYELMRRWTEFVGDPEAAGKYAQEISLSDGGRLLWFPIPEGLLPHMQLDLQPGDRVVLFLVYVGCVKRRPVFAVDDYELLEQTDDEAGDELIYAPSDSPRRTAVFYTIRGNNVPDAVS